MDFLIIELPWKKDAVSQSSLSYLFLFHYFLKVVWNGNLFFLTSVGFWFVLSFFKHKTHPEILNTEYEGFVCKKTQNIFLFFWFTYFRSIQAMMISSLDHHSELLEVGLLSQATASLELFCTSTLTQRSCRTGFTVPSYCFTVPSYCHTVSLILFIQNTIAILGEDASWSKGSCMCLVA